MKKYMYEAINEAKVALSEGEIPVGAIVVKDGKIIGRGRNTRQKDGTVTGHAEIVAITEANKYLSDWRLDGCSIYVTLEPCPMCAGAIINSRISRVYFGAYDSKWGSFESVVNLAALPYESKPEIYGGICEKECSALIKDFFRELR